MHYTLLVVDDNIIERDAVVVILRQLPQTGSIITCKDGYELQKALETHKVDVVFSDIQMPGVDGLNVRKNLTDPPPFVFITSYVSYAAESFDVDAIDFVVKPATFDRVAKAARKAFEYVELKKAARNNASKELGELVVSPAEDHFFIKESKGITRLDYSYVTYIEGMRDFSKIVRADGRTHIVLSGLKSLQAQLPDNRFKRVHKQYIINLEHVETVGRTEVFLKDGSSVALSTAYRNEIMDAFVYKLPIKRA